nr:MAG TPA: hypothetical protein [Bacteriophage sp.]
MGSRAARTPGPRLNPHDTTHRTAPKHAKIHMLIANYALNAQKQPCKALETACNALPINLYT